MEQRKFSISAARLILNLCFLLFFIRLIVLCIKRAEAAIVTEESDEQKALQQALFLVDLLKSEYARVLRENNEMQRVKVLREEDSATCAVTKKDSDASSNISDKEVSEYPQAVATTQNFKWPRSRRLHPIYSLRRQRPRHIGSYFYYDIPFRRDYYEKDYGIKKNPGGWRRFEYEDAFGVQPGDNNRLHTSTTTYSSATSFTNTSLTTISPATTSQRSTPNAPTTTNVPITTNTPTIIDVPTTTSAPYNTPTTTNIPSTTSTFYTISVPSSTIALLIHTSSSITTTISSTKIPILPSSRKPSSTKYIKKTKNSTPTWTSSEKKSKSVTNTPIRANYAATQKMMLSLSVPRKSTWASSKHDMSTTRGTLPLPYNSITTPKVNEDRLFHQQSQSPHENQPEMSQAAAELEMELDSNFVKLNSMYSVSQKVPKNWRGSTRIHLAGSTRYPIPLPENHAFCFTNPNSALCRTFIR